MNKLDAKHITILLLAATVFLVWCVFIVANPVIMNEIVESAIKIKESAKMKQLKEEINFLKERAG